MRVQLRRLGEGKVDHELIWLLVTTFSGAVMGGWLVLNLPWPPCSFRALFGWPCLTCGATRAALSLLRCDLLRAWQFNPFATVGLISMVAFDLYALAVLVTRGRRLRILLGGPIERRLVLGLLVFAALLNWIYLLGGG